MNRFKILTVAFMSAFLTAVAAQAATSTAVLNAAESTDPLTLMGAKKIVANRLTELGKTDLRPGRAEFDKDGNVAVEIVNIQGLPVLHVRVDAKSGQVTDARKGTPLAKNG
jgi:hypothetical protein